MNLHVSLGTGATRTSPLKGVNLDASAGASVALTGKSGSGKTTLLRAVTGEVELEVGTISIAGVPYADSRRPPGLIAFIPQDYRLVPFLSAWENVSLAIELHGKDGATARRIAYDRLERVGLVNHADKRPDDLSGGQQQRVAIARALALEPAVVLADEPTAALDPATAEQSLAVLIESVRSTGAVLVMATHDPLVAAMADDCLALRDGKVTRVYA